MEDPLGRGSFLLCPGQHGRCKCSVGLRPGVFNIGREGIAEALPEGPEQCVGDLVVISGLDPVASVPCTGEAKSPALNHCVIR
jgi:hypothetical protein